MTTGHSMMMSKTMMMDCLPCAPAKVTKRLLSVALRVAEHFTTNWIQSKIGTLQMQKL